MNIIVHPLRIYIYRLLSVRDKIKALYLKSWLYKMPPHYKHFYPFGFDGIINPTGMRSMFGLRWLPYFSGVQIDVELMVKPYLKGTLRVDELNYNWKLISSDSGLTKFKDTGKLTKSPFHNKALSSIIPIPYLVGKGQYYLEIEITQLFREGNLVIYNWRPIFDFELHSEDKLLFGFIIPIVTFVLGMLVLIGLQNLFGIKIP